MDKILRNTRGSVIYPSFMVGLFSLLLFISILALIANESLAVQSYTNSIKAYYLAETGMETTLYGLENAMDKIIFEYLSDLREYKRNYLLESADNSNKSLKFSPPQLDTYLKRSLRSEMSLFPLVYKNHVSTYKQEHSCRISIDYNFKTCIITVESIGEYDRARKFLITTLLLPTEQPDGLDSFDLPRIKIQPFQILSYYQSLGL
ncbi:hypothetical protein HNQ80_002716 [Anaerosolibacter carboniphilus]|uniref:Uncharacterized protein n=1 Tax=Anaerosolibacter carboniphilus TaxID=1417629 RepID=A0A841L0B7_9FIRM|nr:hypothetical protein [Anaerosolibacter carboniphilus]MBB6216612.1 hypothetical protein [Anaerosolibacter carboniphilus]